MKWILVAGTSRPFQHEARRRGYMVGVGLARSEFGLVTGSWPGVDTATAMGFVAEARRVGRDETTCFRQLHIASWRLRALWPGKRYKADKELLIKAGDGLEAQQ